MSDLSRTWSRLRNSPEVHAALALGPDGEELGVHVAVPPEGGYQVLLEIPTSPEEDPLEGTDQIKIKEAWFGELDSMCIVVSCEAAELLDAFEKFIERVLGLRRAGQGGKAAVRTAMDELRRLLRKPKRIEQSVLLGVLGELYLLNELADHSPAAFSTWKGPEDQRQDFATENRRIEVKATRSAGSDSVTIHGPEQLVPPPGGLLWLHHFRFEPVGGTNVGASIRKLVAELDRKGVPGGEIMMKLEEGPRISEVDIGWDDQFQLLDWNAYEVLPGFPRVDPDDIPSGITGMEFRLDLSSADEFRLDDESFATHVRDFCRQES